jgi:hypothetical protein
MYLGLLTWALDKLLFLFLARSEVAFLSGKASGTYSQIKVVIS